jgi:hypothetical protein
MEAIIIDDLCINPEIKVAELEEAFQNHLQNGTPLHFSERAVLKAEVRNRQDVLQWFEYVGKTYPKYYVFPNQCKLFNWAHTPQMLEWVYKFCIRSGFNINFDTQSIINMALNEDLCNWWVDKFLSGKITIASRPDGDRDLHVFQCAVSCLSRDYQFEGLRRLVDLYIKHGLCDNYPDSSREFDVNTCVFERAIREANNEGPENKLRPKWWLNIVHKLGLKIGVRNYTGLIYASFLPQDAYVRSYSGRPYNLNTLWPSDIQLLLQCESGTNIPKFVHKFIQRIKSDPTLLEPMDNPTHLKQFVDAQGVVNFTYSKKDVPIMEDVFQI